MKLPSMIWHIGFANWSLHLHPVNWGVGSVEYVGEPYHKHYLLGPVSIEILLEPKGK